MVCRDTGHESRNAWEEGRNMLQVNEYFDGKVKSIGLKAETGKATVGVMEPGNYEFNTGSPETMQVISGALVVLLPGNTEWKEFPAGTSFDVPGKSSFQLKVARDTAYLCLYE